MRLLLNILWFIFGGWIAGTAWVLAGLILAITIVGLPWTPAAFRIAGFAYWPFGKTILDRDAGASSLLLNIVWRSWRDGGSPCTTSSWPWAWP